MDKFWRIELRRGAGGDTVGDLRKALEGIPDDAAIRDMHAGPSAGWLAVDRGDGDAATASHACPNCQAPADSSSGTRRLVAHTGGFAEFDANCSVCGHMNRYRYAAESVAPLGPCVAAGARA